MSGPELGHRIGWPISELQTGPALDRIASSSLKLSFRVDLIENSDKNNPVYALIRTV